MRTERRILLNGTPYDVEILERQPDRVRFLLEGRAYEAAFEQRVQAPDRAELAGEIQRSGEKATPSPDAKRVSIEAPMPGVVVELLVEHHEVVAAGQPLLRLEAMKMQNSIVATAGGIVAEILVKEGEQVGDHQQLVVLAVEKTAGD